MVMSPDRGGMFEGAPPGPVRTRRAGRDGRQYVSWIHDDDFVRAVSLLIEHEEMAGPVNLAAPGPCPSRVHACAAAGVGHADRTARHAWDGRARHPAPGDRDELVLKSRRVVPGPAAPGRLHLEYPDWPSAGATSAADDGRAVAGSMDRHRGPDVPRCGESGGPRMTDLDQDSRCFPPGQIAGSILALIRSIARSRRGNAYKPRGPRAIVTETHPHALVNYTQNRTSADRQMSQGVAPMNVRRIARAGENRAFGIPVALGAFIGQPRLPWPFQRRRP